MKIKSKQKFILYNSQNNNLLLFTEKGGGQDAY